MIRAQSTPVAGPALASAQPALSDRAELQLYLGLIALQRGEAERAAQSFAQSSQADPDAVEPVASFYQGLALEIEGRRKSAREFTAETHNHFSNEDEVVPSNLSMFRKTLRCVC